MAVFLSWCPRVNKINGTEGRLTIWAGTGTTWASTAPGSCSLQGQAPGTNTADLRSQCGQCAEPGRDLLLWGQGVTTFL